MADGHEQPDRGNRSSASLFLLLLLFLLVGLVILWFAAGQPYGPFFHYKRDNVQAKALMDAARARPLTDVEFDETLPLMKSNELTAQLMIIGVLQLEAARDAERRERIIAALKVLPPSTNTTVQQNVALLLKRLSEKGTHLPLGFDDYGPVHADSLKGKKSCWVTGGSKARFTWEFDGDRFMIREEDGPIPDDALIAILGSRPSGEVKAITGLWSLNDAERTMTLMGIKADILGKGEGEFKEVILKPFNTGVVRINLNEKQYVFSPKP